MTRLLVTGGTGFIGRAVTAVAARRGHEVVLALRTPATQGAPGQVVVGEIGPETDWTSALAGVDTVIHLAGRVHVMVETAPDAMAAFRRVNVEGTRALAEQAARNSVRRLIFLSSIKVNGEQTRGRPFRVGDAPEPVDAYGWSKLEAEETLRGLAAARGLDVVIIRPPMVVGTGAGGNLLRLLRLIAKGLPLPLAGIENRRSLIGRDSLAELLLTAAEAPDAVGGLYLAADEPPVSTPELVRLLARGLGRTPRLWRLPPGLLRGAGRLAGMEAVIDRLVSSLEVDGSVARTRLGWQPRVRIEDALVETASAFAHDTGMRR